MCIPDTINELSMAEAFRFYRDVLGLHVYPVDSPQDEKSDFPGKKPSVRAWWNQNPNQWDVNRFFGKNGHAHNIGVAPRNDVQFIDLDSKQDQGASVRAWLSAHPELGSIPRHDTRNGCHLVVRCPDLPEWKKSTTGRPYHEPVQTNLSEHVSAALYHSPHTNVVLPPSIHRDGGTYSWSVCGDIPEVSWEWLQNSFGFRPPKEAHEPRKAKEKKGQWQDRYEGDLQTLDILGLLEKLGIQATLINEDLDKHSILCPWHAEHAGDQKTGGSDTVIFAPEHKRPGFKCLHDHCSSRGLRELLEWGEAKDPGIVDRCCSRKRVWEDGQDAADGRPRIIPGDRLDSEIHQELGRIIGPKNRWFRFGRTLVAIRKIASGFTYSSDPEEKYRRSAYITGIAGLSAIEAANEIERYVEPGFIRKDSEGQLVFVPRSLSREFCERLIVSDVFLNAIPDLSKILSVPIPMPYKGAITYSKPGYDPRFKTFLRPDSPALEEVSFEDAVRLLVEDVFGGFSFVSEQSRTHALSRLITIFARGLLPSWSTRTPLWSYWGNRPRAGKDYCATIPNILLDGFACEQQPIGKDSAETAKRLMAANLAGAQVLHFSNCQGHLNDAAFTQAITALFISARQLGSNSASAHQGVPNLADYSISLNVGSTCREDLVARSRPIELAFYSEDPNSRTFPRPDLHGWIVENRARIISAIFALFKRWEEKGCPEGPTPFTSFPDWGRVVGGVMHACGLGNPCLPFEAEYASISRDNRTEAMAALYKVCHAVHPDQWIKKTSIYDCVHDAAFPPEQGDKDEQESTEDFNDALRFFGPLKKTGDLAADKEVAGNQTRLGKSLSTFKNRVLGGIKLEVEPVENHTERRRYRFVANSGPDVQNDSGRPGESGGLGGLGGVRPSQPAKSNNITHTNSPPPGVCEMHILPANLLGNPPYITEPPTLGRCQEGLQTLPRISPGHI